MRNCYSRSFVVLLLLLFSSMAFAATTGKIAGFVTDKESGEPLIGANVMVLENGNVTCMGAATDGEGYFAILNIEPGNYDVRVSYVGYSSMTVQDLQVSINLTTELNAGLIVKAISVGDVVVVATRPLLKEDEFASTHNVTAEEMQVQPVDDFMSVAKNQAGVNGSHFRGGRSGEVLVVVDGVPMRDPAGTYSGNTGGFTMGIPSDAISQMEVSLGGFSAEFGNVQSGVINVATDAGGSEFHGKATFLTTNFGETMNEALMPSDDFVEKTYSMIPGYSDMDSTSQDSVHSLVQPGEDRWYTLKYQQKLQNVMRFSLNGPIIPNSNKITFALSGDISDRQQDYFINGESYSQKLYGKVTARLNDKMKLSASSMLSKSRWDQFYLYASKYGPSDEYFQDVYFYDPDTDDKGDTAIIYHYVDNPEAYTDTSYRIGRRDFIEVGGDTITWYEQAIFKEVYVGDRIEDHLWDREQTGRSLNLNFTHQLSSKTYYEIKYQNYYSNYVYGVRDVDDRDGDGDMDEFLQWDYDEEGPYYEDRVRENDIWWVDGDDPGYRNQASVVNKLKFDMESQVDHHNQVRGGFDFTHNNMDVKNISWRTIDFNETDSSYSRTYFRTDIWEQDNIDFGAYIQDKLEFNGIIALIGLRYDYFNPSGFGDAILYPADFSDPYSLTDSTGKPILNNPLEAESSHQISPRFGLSFPLTDRDKFMFTYGHYFQRPDSYYLYRNVEYDNLTATGNYIGNPSLKAEKTVSYDVSLEHLFSPSLKGSITGYYKDVTNLINYEKFVFVNNPSDGNIYVNADFANIKGAEFCIEKVLTHYWGGTLNYTFSSAKGRLYNSYNAPIYGADLEMYPLSYDVTHSIHANLTFRTPGDLSPILRNWRANFQIDASSGSVYSSYGTGRTNDLRMPWSSNVDLRVNRLIDLGSVKMNVFVDVFNLMNTIYIQYLGSSQYYQLEGDAAISGRDVDYSYIYNPQVYNNKRQLRAGLSVQF